MRPPKPSVPMTIAARSWWDLFGSPVDVRRVVDPYWRAFGSRRSLRGTCVGRSLLFPYAHTPSRYAFLSGPVESSTGHVALSQSIDGPDVHGRAGRIDPEPLAVLSVFWLGCLARVVGALQHSETFGAEPTLAALALVFLPCLIAGSVSAWLEERRGARVAGHGSIAARTPEVE